MSDWTAWKVKGLLQGEEVWLYEQEHSGSNWHWGAEGWASVFTDKAEALAASTCGWESVSNIELGGIERRDTKPRRAKPHAPAAP